MQKTIYTLILLTLLISCSEKKEANVMHLTGNIKGLQKGTLFVQKMIDTNLVVVETINIDGDSHFESKIKITEPDIYYLYLDRGVTNSNDNSLTFIAEPGTVNIETNLENYLYGAKITGTKSNEIYEDHKKIIRRFNDENLTLTSLRFEAFKSKNAAKVDSINQKQEANLKRKYLYTVNFALNNKDYEVAPLVTISEINDVNLKYLDTIQKSMSPKVAKSNFGKKLKELYQYRKNNE